MYSLTKIADLLGSSLKNDKKNPPVFGYAVDSKQVRPGSLFFALKGMKVDGHQFLEEAALNGALGAVVEANYQGEDFGIELIRAGSPLKALQDLACFRLKEMNAIVVAVTGSVGKTTTKDFIFELLKPRYKVLASPGNRNSQIGLPLTLLNEVQGDEDVLVLEMGMTHAGEIANLVEIAPPDIALITAVALVHAENFDSIHAIGLAKAEIFSHPKTKIGILNGDMLPLGTVQAVGGCQKLLFSSLSSKADYFLEEKCGEYLLRLRDKEAVKLDLSGLPGAHHRENFLAAAAVAAELDVGAELIAQSAKSLKLPAQRFEVVEKKGVVFVNDSYNASEISIKAALKALPLPKPGGKKIAVLGEMLELGKFSEKCHYDVGVEALKFVDSMMCFGEGCAPMCRPWHDAGRPALLFDDHKNLVDALEKMINPGDVVLLKGSRKSRMEKVLELY